MRLRVLHRTTYHYDRPVVLEPHFLRVRPRSGPAQTVEAFSLRLDPAPAGLSHGLDAEGDWLTTAWFREETDALVVEATICAQTLRKNPFDFLLVAPDPRVGGTLYSEGLARHLDAALVTSDEPAAHRLAREVDQGDGVVDYLRNLNNAIFARLPVVHRAEGAPWAPDKTLAEGKGACRDLALLFVEMCRSRGIAARFASGFHYDGEGRDAHYLHAWAEVYLPGAGWRGFDPSVGLAAADGHLTVAASTTIAGAAPVIGTFRGDGAQARMETEVSVARLPE